MEGSESIDLNSVQPVLVSSSQNHPSKGNLTYGTLVRIRSSLEPTIMLQQSDIDRNENNEVI